MLVDIRQSIVPRIILGQFEVTAIGGVGETIEFLISYRVQGLAKSFVSRLNWWNIPLAG